MHLPLDDGTALVQGHLTATRTDWFLIEVTLESVSNRLMVGFAIHPVRYAGALFRCSG